MPLASHVAVGRPRSTPLVDVPAPACLVLTPGNTSDVKGADMLIGENIGMKRVIADRGYDANRIRASLARAGNDPGDPRSSQPQTPDPV